MDILNQLREIVGQTHVLNGDDAERYSADWLKQYHWTPLAVVRPSSTEEVARVVEFADQNKLSIVPMGGNTGLPGRHAPKTASCQFRAHVQDPRNSQRCQNSIVEAGAIYPTFTALWTITTLFSFDIRRKGFGNHRWCDRHECRWIECFTYGNTRDLILGLEVVTPKGQVMDLMSELHKDNSGYNLRNLIVGAEGSLGIVTAAVLKFNKTTCIRNSDGRGTFFADALRLLNDLQSNTGGAVEAFEYMPKAYIDRHLEKFQVLAPHLMIAMRLTSWSK